MPTVLNLRYLRQIPPNSMRVDRSTKYGNPYRIGHDGDRRECIAKFKKYIPTRPDLVAIAKKELRGKDLLCWCVPEDCHAWIWVDIVNDQC